MLLNYWQQSKYTRLNDESISFLSQSQKHVTDLTQKSVFVVVTPKDGLIDTSPPEPTFGMTLTIYSLVANYQKEAFFGYDTDL